jgi:protein TonB
MHANRYQPSASRPASAGASLLVLAAVGFGATLVGPTIVPGLLPEPPIFVTNVPIDPPKPTPQPLPKKDAVVKQQTTPLPHQPTPIVKSNGAADPIGATSDFTESTMDPPGPVGPASGGTTVADPPKPPVMIGATVDPRYADALQPPYPNSEIRAQTEGKLVARVLVGVDGRVKAIEILRTPSKGLSEATRRHALSRWRFKPATRDGIPYEDWMTMTLSFKLVD